MSFEPLAVNQTVDLDYQEACKHLIDFNGDSPLPCYADSIFAVIYHPSVKIYSNGAERNTEPSWIVTRILRSEVDLPLDKPVTLTSTKISALQIKPNGLSDRPDLSQYRFEVESIDTSTYRITKREL